MRLEDSMEERTRGGFEIVDRQLVAEGTDLRVKVLTLAAGSASRHEALECTMLRSIVISSVAPLSVCRLHANNSARFPKTSGLLPALLNTGGVTSGGNFA
jgi:hypothetical protein